MTKVINKAPYFIFFAALAWLLSACGAAPEGEVGVAQSALNPGDHVYHFAYTGQSQCWGVGGNPATTSIACGFRVRPDLLDLEPLLPYDEPNAGVVDMPAFGLACEIADLLDGPVIVDTYCRSNNSLTGIRKGTFVYDGLLEKTQAAKTIVEAAGATFHHRGLVIEHGERDLKDQMPRSQYSGLLTNHVNDWLTDVSGMNPVGDPDPIVVVAQSTNGTLVGGTTFNFTDHHIALAQRDVVQEDDRVFFAGPNYNHTFYQAGTNQHLSNVGHLGVGADAGRAFLGNIALDFESVTKTDTQLHVKFNDDVELAPNGTVWYENYGFVCNNRTITAVEPCFEPDTIILTLDSVPDASTVCTYANHGVDGAPAGPVSPDGQGGNVRSASNPLNWSVSFDVTMPNNCQ